MKKENLAMLCDFYEFTMSNGYFKYDFYKRKVYFDVFYRKVPDNGGFAIAAGLEQVIDYIKELHFDDDDIAYFRSKGIFDEEFLDYLKDFRFTGDIWAVPEGTPVFPNEPILTVRAPAIEAQIIETYVLLSLNHQTLIATKANRIVRAAQGRAVLEFGSRRAQGESGAVLGARAAYIGGCAGTACTLTDELYGVPAGGTMAHSWVQMFDSEYEAFRAYCELYPDNPTLLVDTYNTLRSGIPNAIKVFKEVLLPQGRTKCAIRLDSGDISYLSKSTPSESANGLSPLPHRLFSAEFTSSSRSRTPREISNRKSRSARMPPRSQTRISRRSTATTTTRAARLSPTSSAFMTRLSTIPSPTQYLTPTLLGKPRP